MTKEKSITGGEVDKPPMKKDGDALAAFDFLMRELKSFIDESDADNTYSLKINKWSKAVKAAIVPITGDTSDGYHTFNELYAHRHALFIALMKCHKDKSWRSLLHSDGTMFAGWFIAGINTPDGQATYHMPMSVWETTEGIETLRTAPEWDGHTPADVITRIGHLKTTGEDEKGVDLDAALNRVAIDFGRRADEIPGHYKSPCYMKLMMKDVDVLLKAARDHLASTGRIRGEWRPISEAPRDGTYILVYQPDALAPDITVVAWIDDWWHACDGKNPELALRGHNPTHFMPLPAAPGGE